MRWQSRSQNNTFFTEFCVVGGIALFEQGSFQLHVSLCPAALLHGINGMMSLRSATNDKDNIKESPLTKWEMESFWKQTMGHEKHFCGHRLRPSEHGFHSRWRCVSVCGRDGHYRAWLCRIAKPSSASNY